MLLDCVKNDTTSDRVRLLLELGANPNYTIEEKANLNLVEKDFITVTYVSDIHTPLLEAAKNKKPYLIPLLVAYGAELDYQYAPADGLFNFKIRDYEQNLFINAKEDITTIKALIVAGGNIKTQDTNGFNVIQKISLYDDKNDYKTLDF